MSGSNHDFIYTYDDDTQQMIVINAETGERVEEKDDRVLSMLIYLYDKGSIDKLRKFTVWCAYETNSDIKPLQRRFLEQAEQVIHQPACQHALQRLYAKSESKAVALDTVSLRQGSKKAAGFLGSRECVNPDALEGAKNAARFHCLWAEMNHNDDELPGFMNEFASTASEEMIEETKQKQVDYLLDLIGQNC